MRRPRAFVIACVGMVFCWAGCNSLIGNVDAYFVADASVRDVVPAEGSEDAAAPDAAAELELQFVPASVELHQDGRMMVRLTVAAAMPLAANTKITLSPAATTLPGQDGGTGISPLSVDQSTFAVTPDVPQVTFEVHADAMARHGFHGIDVFATTTAADGKVVTGRATLPVRVVGYPGELDTGFGDQGGYFDFCPSIQCAASDVLVQNDGSFVVAGHAGQQASLLVARFKSGGTLDSTFNGAGALVATTTNSIFSPGLARLPDGSYVVAWEVSARISLLHILPNGTLDGAWGGPNGLMTGLGGGGSLRGAMATTPSGDIVVSGRPPLADASAAEVRQFHADGSVDSTFGDGGVVALAVGPMAAGAATAIDPNGFILSVGGSNELGAAASSFVARVAANGAFAQASIKKIPGSANEKLDVVAADGTSIVAAGFAAFGPDVPQTVYRLDALGNNDPTFHGGVPLLLDAGGLGTLTLAVQADHALLISNDALKPPVFYIIRFDGSGKADTSFGDAGEAQEIAGSARATALTSEGRELIVVGSDPSTSASRARIARYWLR